MTNNDSGLLNNTNAYKLCISCGNFCGIKEKQIHCIVCGENMIKECSSCREPVIYPTAKHCYNCGISYTDHNKLENQKGDL